MNATTILEKRLASYGAMSLAVATGFAGAPAQANSISYINVTGQAGTSTVNGPVEFNPLAGTIGPSNFAFDIFQSIIPSFGNPSCSSPGNHQPGLCSFAGVNINGNNNGRIAVQNGLVKDVFGSIPGGLQFTNAGTIVSDGQGSNFPLQTEGYIGLIENGYYGWAQIQVISSSDVNLLAFAIDERAGESITAGQASNNTPFGGGNAPEPGTLALLAVGAAGLAALRRRKNMVQVG